MSFASTVFIVSEGEVWSVYIHKIMRPDSLLRLWRYINHLLTFFLQVKRIIRCRDMAIWNFQKL